MRWSREEELACHQMIRQGMSYSQIGEVLGRDKDSVAHFVCAKRKKDPGTWRRYATKNAPSKQKCNDCFYASGARKNGWKCPWADRLEPVKGWDATPTTTTEKHTTVESVIESFDIRDCPHYEFG